MGKRLFYRACRDVAEGEPGEADPEVVPLAHKVAGARSDTGGAQTREDLEEHVIRECADEFISAFVPVRRNLRCVEKQALAMCTSRPQRAHSMASLVQQTTHTSTASDEPVAALALPWPSSPQPSRRPLPGGAVAALASGRHVAPCKASNASGPSAADHVGDVEEQTWDKVVLGSETAVLVEFWVSWCGPCRLMHPIIADLAKAYVGKLRCLMVVTDQNQEVAMRYDIRSIPTILIFKDCERKETVTGTIANTALAATVDRFL
nr:thioredoxin M1, chloroplastic-like [Aegilops tauschii subsp. strangulata]